MSHEITIRANSFAEFAHVGAKGWHGLGQQLTHGASIDEWARAAGMDWHIRRAMTRYFADPEGSRDMSMMMEFADRDVLFRSDTLAGLGSVSPKYEIVQPRDVLAFFEDIAESAGMTLETAGTLFGGRRFFATAKIGEGIVRGQDRVAGYIVLCTSADGTLATEARQTTIRVVCNNTLTAARNERGEHVKPIKVGHRSKFNADAVRAQLGLASDNFERGMQAIRQLADIRMSDAAGEEFVRRLLRPEEFTDKALAAKAAAQVIAQASAGQTSDFQRLIGAAAPLVNIRPDDKRAPKGEGKILELFRSSAMGGTLAGTQGTAWGMVNAVTEFVDHHKGAKSPDHRTDSALFGDGEELKQRAFELAFTFK